MSERLALNALPSIQRGPARRWWQRCVALWTVFSFILLLATSAVHHHNGLGANDCAACSAVLHQIADLPPVPLAFEHSAIFLYFLVRPTAPITPYVAALLPPPSCGPPSSWS